ncbi:MAG: alpha/beta hydrolase [Planctomycetota bacterium]
MATRHLLPSLTLAPLLSALLALGFAQSKAERPPSQKQCKEIAAEVFTLGSRATGAARTRQLEQLAPLTRTEDLGPRDEAKWRKELLKLWDKQPGLPFDKGDGFYWEENKRGRYIVGGKTKKPKGLMIAMHGGGVGSADAGPAAALYEPAANELEYVMIAPQAIEATECGWTDSGTEEWVWDLVEQARRTFGVDADHVLLCGHSMGGYGSWTLGAHHADRVSALAPAAGAPSPIMELGTEKIIDLAEGVIPNLRNVPMVVYQSADDPRVPPGPNRFAAERIAAAKERWGGFEQFEYWEVNGRAHDPPEGGPQAHIARLKSLDRVPVQDTVVWQPALDWKRQFYWLFWEKPAIGATVYARIDRAANRITIDIEPAREGTQGEGLAVLLDDTLVNMEQPVTVALNGKTVFEAVPVRRLEVLVETALTGDPGRVYCARVPVE